MADWEKTAAYLESMARERDLIMGEIDVEAYADEPKWAHQIKQVTSYRDQVVGLFFPVEWPRPDRLAEPHAMYELLVSWDRPRIRCRRCTRGSSPTRWCSRFVCSGPTSGAPRASGSASRASRGAR